MASPGHVAAAFGLLSAGAWHQAEAEARAAIADEPGARYGVLLLGLAVAAMGEAKRAAAILVEVAAREPEASHPCLDLVRLTPPLPRLLIARQFRACLRLAPEDDRLRLDFAGFLLGNGEAAEAEAVLAQGPDTAEGQHLMGLVQGDLGEFSAAVDSFRRAAALAPDAGASWSNLGMMLKVEGRFAEAIEAHGRAVALEPANHRYRVNRATALLKMGAWESAWRDYESRLELTGLPSDGHDRLMPSLRPHDTLMGVTVVAMHEDGFGDTLQFLRYLPLLAARGAHVVACVPPALERVMRMVPGVATVVTDPTRLPPHHFLCPMFSLPRVFGTTVDTIPSVPALVTDPTLENRWAGCLPRGGLRAGLVWAGQARPALPGFAALDRRRSAGLMAFAPLFDVSGVTFVSLQAGPAARQLPPAGSVLVNPMPDVGDFADTGAIIAALDVVISVDTSVVHLAGLMGKPVFLLDRYDGCWRWLSGRNDSPWYPLLSIFRQSVPNDWSGPVVKVAAALKAMARSRGVGAREHTFLA